MISRSTDSEQHTASDPQLHPAQKLPQSAVGLWHKAWLASEAEVEANSPRTRLRRDSGQVSSSGTVPAEGFTGEPAVGGVSTSDRCGVADWCAANHQGSGISQRSMPPADPGRASNHVADTGLMLQEQQPAPAAVASVQLRSPMHTAPDAAAGRPTAQQLVEAGQEPRKHERPEQPVAATAGATDSEDDSWSPGQPQHSEDQAGAATSLDGSDDDMMAAAYDDLDGHEDEAAWDPRLPAPVYCTNCTARLIVSDRCSDCGHSNDQDSELLTCSAVSADTSTEAAADGSCPLIIWDDSMLLHEEGKLEPHPERPDRLRAVIAQLQGNGLTGLCQRVAARLATKDELLRVHTPDHLHRLQLFCSGQVPPSAIPSDTYINQHTLQCAALAAGSAAEVAVRVFRGEAPCGAAIIRPPGHHAESNTAMGFCFFNNAAVAARAAQEAGAQRVLILDWDVHHGNGTQHIFEDDDTVLYMSLHRYDRGTFYPGTGAATEVGQGDGEGFTVNVPWDTDGVSDGDYMAAMQQVLLPIAREFAPDLILISAGFDAAAGDPIGGCNLTPDCFGAMTAALMPIAPTVLLLEGGYNLRSTALSTEACLRVLLGEPGPQLHSATPSPYAWFSIQAVRKAHCRYWGCLAGALPPLHLHAPGWGLAAAAAAAGSAGAGAGGAELQQPRQQGSEGVELQYGEDYEEADCDWDGEEEEGEEEEEDQGDDDDGQYAGDDVDADMGIAGAAADSREHGASLAAAQQQQPQQQGLAGLAARRGASAGHGGRQGSKQGVGGGVDDAAGVDAVRRGRFAAAGCSTPPHQKQRGLQPVLLPAHSAGWPLRRLSSSGSVASSNGSSRRGGRVVLSRKQQMLQAIHKRAMQLYLRRQRRAAAAQQQQQRQRTH